MQHFLLRSVTTVALAACFSALLVGCTPEAEKPSAATESQSTSATTSGTGTPFKITMIAKSSTNPFFLSTRTGAEARAKELSESLGREITIDWRTPPDEDGQVQAQRVNEAVADGTNAILLSCSDAGKLKGAIDDAVAKGVPVATFDSDVPDSKRFTFVGSDNYDMGAKIGEELVALCNGKANVALLCGNQNAPNLAIRRQGVEDAFKKAPGMKIVGTFYNPEKPQDAAAEVMRVMQAQPEIDAWAFIGGWPLFTTTLLTELDPKRVRIVSADALPPELAYVDEGVVPVLIAQRSYDLGALGVEKIVEHAIEKKNVPKNVNPELTKVTKENLREWAAQLKEWGFTDVPAKYLQP
jgi:ribose transport system substrate-binding protein